MRPKVIINLPDCKIKKYQDQQRECYETWIPEVRKIGIEVVESVSEETLDSEYKLDGGSLLCKCNDNLDENFVLKRYYFLKWALENRDFDYVFVTSFDTFVHPLRFVDLVNWHFKNPHVEASGDVFPRMGWDPWKDFVVRIDQSEYPLNLSISGGSGYLLNRRAVHSIVTNYHKNYGHPFKPMEDDQIFSRILKENGIDIWHHSRIITSSPQDIYWDDPHNIGVPRIDQRGGEFLAVQSPLDGNMHEVFENLKDEILFLDSKKL